MVDIIIDKYAKGTTRRDFIKDGYMHHAVKKVWKGIVSCGSYTIDKCKSSKVGLRLCYENDYMTLSLPQLDDRSFRLHQKVVKSQFGRDYTMIDFRWKPDGKHEIYVAPEWTTPDTEPTVMAPMRVIDRTPKDTGQLSLF